MDEGTSLRVSLRRPVDGGYGVLASATVGWQTLLDALLDVSPVPDAYKILNLTFMTGEKDFAGSALLRLVRESFPISEETNSRTLATTSALLGAPAAQIDAEGGGTSTSAVGRGARVQSDASMCGPWLSHIHPPRSATQRKPLPPREAFIEVVERVRKQLPRYQELSQGPGPLAQALPPPPPPVLVSLMVQSPPLPPPPAVLAPEVIFKVMPIIITDDSPRDSVAEEPKSNEVYELPLWWEILQEENRRLDARRAVATAVGGLLAGIAATLLAGRMKKKEVAPKPAIEWAEDLYLRS